MAKFQENMNLQGRQYIQTLAKAVKQLWQKACEHDQIPIDNQIPPNTMFCIFSNDNPFVPFYESALSQFYQAKQQYADGGYVGLSTKKRRLA